MSKEEKTFKLPKAFAEEWLKALRSGEYEQGADLLLSDEVDQYCCLGVAGIVCHVPKEYMREHALFTDLHYSKIREVPEILKQKTPESEARLKKSLVDILTSMNDGMYWNNYKATMVHYPKLKFRSIPPEGNAQMRRYSFLEIADWIEDNIEFTEDEQEKSEN